MSQQQEAAADYRALLTDREEEILRGDPDVSESYYFRVVSRVRKKIQQLERDREALEATHEQLARELRDAVCGPEAAADVDQDKRARARDRLLDEPTLHGSGELLEARVDAVLLLYDRLRENEGRHVHVNELRGLITPDVLDAIEYSSVDSFWANFIKKHGDRPNAIALLPGVEYTQNGLYRYRHD